MFAEDDKHISEVFGKTNISLPAVESWQLEPLV